MSIGSFGGIQGSAAGAPLSQTKGSETEKAQQQAASSERQATAAEKSEQAAGIGTTEEDQEAGDRDADGRRMYEDAEEGSQQTDTEATTQLSPAAEPPKSKDPTGQTGNTLDLMG